MKKSVSFIPYLTISSNIGSDVRPTNWDLPPVSSVIYSELINLSVSKDILNAPVPPGITWPTMIFDDTDFNLSDSLNIDSNLTGEIPIEIGSLINLQQLDLRNNELTGNLPEELTNLNNLSSLLLSGNQLSGQIPVDIELLQNLVSLDIGKNQLSGQIPESFLDKF